MEFLSLVLIAGMQHLDPGQFALGLMKLAHRHQFCPRIRKSAPAHARGLRCQFQNNSGHPMGLAHPFMAG